MKFPQPPFPRWPAAAHLACAALLLLALLASGRWGVSRLQERTTLLDREAARLQQKIRQSQATVQPVPRRNFTSDLAAAATVDDVARDMARFAQSRGVQLGAVAMQTQAKSERELGRVQLTATVQGNYKNNKAWLAELLARYAALGVSTLSMQATDAEGARQTLQVTLVLFLKD